MSKKSKLEVIKTPASIGILSYIADFQGCGYIRVVYPSILLPHLKIKGVRALATYLPYFIADPGLYKHYTIVQIQRFCEKNHLNIVKEIKNIQRKTGFGLVYEIDDDLLDIPEWNYACQYYNLYKPFVEEILKLCNGIVVSTLPLKTKLSKYNDNVEVIPNHLPKFVWGDVYPAHKYYKEGAKVKILYAGSSNHFAQVPHIKKGITGGDFGDKVIDFIKKTTDKYEWIIIGGIPHQLEEAKDKIQYYEWKSIFEYPSFIKSLEADIGIAPLENNEFNKSKSNIKMLEYCACGMAGIYSKMPPYNKATIQTKTEEEMISHIERLAESVDERAKVWEKDFNTVYGQLWWEENDNLEKYVDTYLRMFDKKLP